MRHRLPGLHADNEPMGEGEDGRRSLQLSQTTRNIPFKRSLKWSSDEQLDARCLEVEQPSYWCVAALYTHIR